jgi:hypothetical protein
MTLDKTLINRIYRQYELAEEEIEDYTAYDDIVAMKWEGIPNLRDEDYYVQYIDTTGRDIVQQAVNIYSTQRPKWDVLPRGLGDVDTAEEFERVIEWYMWKAAQMGRKRFHSEALINACKYNKVCAQLEWVDNYFCVKIYHPSSVVYEYGNKLQWVSVVNNVTAVSIIEHWSAYAKEGWEEKTTRGDQIGKALRKIQDLTDDDSSQRMMYVDYTDDKRRYTYCFPVSDERIDDSFGYDDNGKEKDDVIVIQDKTNELGFINWAIAEGEGDPLLSPLLKGGMYNRINEEETILRTKAFRIAFEPMYLQQGREDADATIDYSGGEVVMKAPQGASITKLNATPLDPAFGQLAAQDKNAMTNAIGIASSATMMASNIQHSTLQEQIKLRLAQLEPYKRITEQAFVQIAYLMFKWAKKKDKILKGQVLYTQNSSAVEKGNYERGSEINIEPAQINLDALYIECRILPNNDNDKLQITNQIAMLKQSGIAIPDDEFMEMLYMGSPDILRARYEKQEIRNAALQAKLKEIVAEVDMAMQMKMKQFDAQLNMQVQQAQMQQQQQQMQAQQQQMPQGAPQGQVPPQDGMPMPSDATTQGQGMNAAQGGMPPQQANPELTQSMRP